MFFYFEKLVFTLKSSRIFSLLIFMLFCAKCLQAEDNERIDKIAINGYVTGINGEIISDVLVYDKQGGNMVYTDDRGSFSLILSKGYVQIDISHIEYRKQRITLLSQVRDTTLKVLLVKKEREISEIIVTGKGKSSQVLSPQMGSLSMDKAMIKKIPTLFGEADVIKALQIQPGVSSGTEGFTGMYVRGGNGDENLYMLDGIPLYQITHLGGLFSTFNPEFIKDIQFYKSSFPAQYGGKISSVLNVHTKEGDMENYHGSFMLGLTSGNISLEGPLIKNKTSFQVSLRRSWLEILSVPALAIMNKNEDGKNTIGRYAFTDFNLKINHSFNSRSKAFLNIYWGNDYLKVGEENYTTVAKEIDEEDVFHKDLTKLKWGNLLLSGGLSYALNEIISTRFDVAYVKYNSNIKHDIMDNSGNTGDINYNENYFKRSSDNGITDIIFNANFTYYPTSIYQISWGANYTHHMYRPESFSSTILKNNIRFDNKVMGSRIGANEVGIYIENDWISTPLLRINAGLRLNFFSIYDKRHLSLEPRASIRYLLTSDLSFKTSYSRMTQYAQQLSNSYINLPTDYWMPVGENRIPLNSDQISAGLFFDFKKNYSFSVEGYYKWMSNLIEYKDGYDSFTFSDGWENKIVSSGKGWAYGVELCARKNIGRLTGWGSYGLMWANRNFKEINNGISYPAKYDNRHKLNIMINYKLKENIEINVGWTYVTGNRITVSLENYMDPGMSGFPPSLAPTDPNEPLWGIDHYDSRNNLRLPAYHRLDLGVNFYRPSINGRMGIWSVGLYNAYSQMNPVVFRKKIMLPTDVNKQWDATFQTLSIFPLIPSVSYTYKF